MSLYLIPIQTALFVFPILAVILTIPYILHQYRHYGATLPLRILIVFSFIFYLLCCYFLVSLPLPPIEEVAHYTTPKMQLIPFASLKDISLTTSFVWDDPTTYLTALNEFSVLQVLFNIFMTMPFGIYLHYYFEYSFKKTMLCSFLLSLSFECLQLSGLFFIYPRPYRLFDVDDLITNTLGGVIGYGLTPIVAHFLPSREKLDERSYHKGMRVSAMRRMFAFAIDIIVTLILYIMISFLLPLRFHFYGYLIIILLLYFIVPCLSKGRTLGKMMVKIRLVNFQNQNAKWYQYLLHFLPTYLLILPFPYIILAFILVFMKVDSPLLYVWYAGFALYLAIYLFYVFDVMLSMFQHKENIYDKIGKVKNISTIKVKLSEDYDHADLEREENECTS